MKWYVSEEEDIYCRPCGLHASNEVKKNGGSCNRCKENEEIARRNKEKPLLPGLTKPRGL